MDRIEAERAWFLVPGVNDRAIYDSDFTLRPTPPIVPYLRELSWLKPYDFPRCSLLLHEGIRKFDIALPLMESPGYIHGLLRLVPNLYELRLAKPRQWSHHFYQFDGTILPYFQELTRLVLTGLVFEVSDSFLAICSTFPSLSHLDVMPILGRCPISSHIPSGLTTSSFSQLRSLRMTVMLDELSNVMRSKTVFALLRDLTIRTPWAVDRNETESFGRFIEAVVACCSELDALDVRLVAFTHHNPIFDEHQQIGIRHLKPLRGNIRLRRFCLTHWLPLSLTDDDIDNLTINWSSIELLSLNPCPGFITRSSLTVASVGIICINCPSIDRMHLNVDGHAPIMRSPVVIPTLLRKVEFGVSSLTHWMVASNILRYLRSVLPRGTIIASGGVPWYAELSVRSRLDDTPDIVRHRVNTRHTLDLADKFWYRIHYLMRRKSVPCEAVSDWSLMWS
jgi:hypothetical protein